MMAVSPLRNSSRAALSASTCACSSGVRSATLLRLAGGVGPGAGKVLVDSVGDPSSATGAARDADDDSLSALVGGDDSLGKLGLPVPGGVEVGVGGGGVAWDDAPPSLSLPKSRISSGV